MENKISLKGTLRDIRPSHTVGDIQFEQADLIVPRGDQKEDLITIKYKKFCNTHKENDVVELVGNVRSYSHTVNDKNKVDVYVFTYFDRPVTGDAEVKTLNDVTISGRICKMQELRTFDSGKTNIHFILANNITTDNSTRKLNSYIPCMAWGQLAKDISKYKVGTKVSLDGMLQSREYKKVVNGNVELRLAHELVIKKVRLIDDI